MGSNIETYILKLPKDKEEVNQLTKNLRECAERIRISKIILERENPNWEPKNIMLACQSSLEYMNLIVLSELLLQEEINSGRLFLELENEGLIYDEDTSDRYKFAVTLTMNYCQTVELIE